MSLLEGVITFLFGTALGSFSNVVALRFPNSTLTGRSRCPRCHRHLSAAELIPILSFILLRGRCRQCQQPISVQYPIVELAMGLSTLILFTPLPLNSADFLSAFLNLTIVALLIILFVIDLRTMLLPDRFVLLLTLTAIALTVVRITNYELRITNSLLGALIGVGFLGTLWLLTRGRGIGLGDVKLMLPLGLMFGAATTGILLMTAFITGGLVGTILLLTGRATRKTTIPFGPFLTGTAILFILAPQLPPQLLKMLIN